MITNPTSYQFNVSTDPAVQGYDVYAKKVVDGTLIATQTFDLAHMPPPVDGVVTVPFTELAASIGSVQDELQLSIDAYVGDVKSPIVTATNTFRVVVVGPPSNLVIVP